MKLIKNKLLIGILIFFMLVNGVLIYLIDQNFTPTINYREKFEPATEYVWNSNVGKVATSKYQAKVEFTGDEQKVYLYMFETYKASNKYAELATVPSYVRDIQFDCLLYLKPGLVVTAYLEQFDSNGERIEECLVIDKIETDSIRENNSAYGQFFYSIKAKKHENCDKFNVLFDIRPNGTAGTFTISDMDIIFSR